MGLVPLTDHELVGEFADHGLFVALTVHFTQGLFEDLRLVLLLVDLEHERLGLVQRGLVEVLIVDEGGLQLDVVHLYLFEPEIK